MAQLFAYDGDASRLAKCSVSVRLPHLRFPPVHPSLARTQLTNIVHVGGRWKLIDLASSASFGEPFPRRTAILAPELLIEDAYSCAEPTFDVWGFVVWQPS